MVPTAVGEEHWIVLFSLETLQGAKLYTIEN